MLTVGGHLVAAAIARLNGQAWGRAITGRGGRRPTLTRWQGPPRGGPLPGDTSWTIGAVLLPGDGNREAVDTVLGLIVERQAALRALGKRVLAASMNRRKSGCGRFGRLRNSG